MKKFIVAVGRLFDIYSPSPWARITVIGTMLLAAYLLTRGLASRSAIAALPLLLLVLVNRVRFMRTVENLLKGRPLMILVIPAVVLLGRFIVTPPTASDDLLRHIAVSAWHGDYRQMYVHSYLPAINLYPSFDWAVGRLAASIGFAQAMWSVQALALGAFVAVFLSAAGRNSREHPLGMAVTVLALCVVLLAIGYRFMLGRPEVFLLIWALAACAVKGRKGVLIWTMAGALMSTGYWLAPVCFPAASLLPLSIRQRVAVFGLLMASWAGFWWVTTDGAFLLQFVEALRMTTNRIPGMHVGENQSLLAILLDPWGLVVVLGSVLAFRSTAADHRLAWLAAYFAISNQFRYLGIIVPLLALHGLSALLGSGGRLQPFTRSMAVALAVAAVCAFSSSTPSYAELPRFRLPEGAVVLTGFQDSTYSTLFANPGKVRVAPAMEVGWLAPSLQHVVLELNGGKLDCTALEGYGFTHLVEASLSGPKPDCLDLVEVHGRWRLWRLRQ